MCDRIMVVVLFLLVVAVVLLARITIDTHGTGPR